MKPPRSAASLAVALVLAFAVVPGLPAGAQPALNLSASPAVTSAPQVAADGAAVHVVWVDLDQGAFLVRYRRSLDGGRSFEPAQTLVSFSGGTAEVRVAAAGTVVLVAWTQGNNVFLRRSANTGATFAAAQNLSGAVGLLGIDLAEVALSGSTALVAWSESFGFNAEVFVARSADGGASFAPKLNVSSTPGPSVSASIALSGTVAVVTWQEGSGDPSTIQVRASLNGGLSYGIPRTLSSTRGRAPRVAADGLRVSVVWEDFTGAAQPFHAASEDGGVTFAAGRTLSAGVPGSLPDVAVGGSVVHAVWGGTAAFHRRSADAGRSFATIQSLSSGSAVAPNVVARGDTVAVVWQQALVGGNQEVFVNVSTNGGVAFAGPRNLSTSAGASTLAAGVRGHVAIGASAVAAAWVDDTPGNAEAFLGLAPLATAVTLAGTVTARTPVASQTLVLGGAVPLGTAVGTAAASSVTLRAADGDFTVSPATDVGLLVPAGATATVASTADLVRGTVRFAGGTSPAGAPPRLRTATAEVHPRGTDCAATYTQAGLMGTTLVQVLEGVCEVLERRTGQRVALAAGQSATFEDLVPRVILVSPTDQGAVVTGRVNAVRWTALPGTQAYLIQYTLAATGFAQPNPATPAPEPQAALIGVLPGQFTQVDGVVEFAVPLAAPSGTRAFWRVFPADAALQPLPGTTASDAALVTVE
jgi:hypothetical protein